MIDYCPEPEIECLGFGTPYILAVLTAIAAAIVIGFIWRRG